MMPDDEKPDPSVVAKAFDDLSPLRVYDKDAEPPTVGDVIPDAPKECADHVIPAGFQLFDEIPGSSCLFRVTPSADGRGTFTELASNPILITAWCTNETTKRKSLEISWKALGSWHRAIIERPQAVDTNKLIDALSPLGFEADSINKRHMVRYLTSYERANKKRLPVRKISEQLGWQSDGGFLAGRRSIQTCVKFVGADSGEDQMADAVCEEGGFDEWAAAVKTVAGYPRVIVALYASLAVPLLEILHAPSFALDWSYETSSGKTTALHVAASAWGCPDERSSRSLIKTWGGTSIGVERIASVYSGLPLILDDTKRARFIRGQSMAASALYTVTSGAADIRGSKQGLKAMRYWRTILLSTGESRIVDASKDGGTAARALCLWGIPFGEKTRAIDQIIAELDSKLFAHYGHAGPRFVAWLLDNKHEWPNWAAQKKDLRREIAAGGQGGVASRMAGYLATLEIAARLAHRALDLPWKLVSPAKLLSQVVEDGESTADRATEALDHMYTWALAHRDRFFDNNKETQEWPKIGWAGRWDRDTHELTPKSWEWLGFTRQTLDEELRRAGFDPAAIARIWMDRGWLDTNRDRKRATKVVRAWDQSLVRVIAVTRRAIESVTGGSDE